MRKILCFTLIIIVLSASLPCCAYAHQCPDKVSIHDFSGVLSDGIKNYVKEKNEILLSGAEAKIIFVMTESSGEESVTQFCENLYTSWGISSIGRRNSIFIVADTKKEEYAFLIGRGIRLALTESEMYKYMVDFFEPYFAKKDYDKAVFRTFNALGKWYEENYTNLSLELDDDVFKYVGGAKTKDEDKEMSKTWIWIALGVFVVLLIIVLKIKRNIELKIRQHERRRLRKKFKIDIDKITKS